MRLERNGTEEFPSPVDHQQLDRRNQPDQGQKEAVAEDPREQPEPFGAGVHAVEKPRKDEQDEKGG